MGSGELKRVLTSVQVNLIRIQSRAFEAESGREKMRLEDYRAIAAAVLAGDARAPRRRRAGTSATCASFWAGCRARPIPQSRTRQEAARL